MSRILKFRIWDKANKEYKILGATGLDARNGDVIDYYNEGNRLGGPDEYDVEQYTGLKDKNGKEVYEGDVVRTTDRVTVKGLIFPVGIVEFKQQAFWICNVPSERPDFTHNETLLQYWETDLEVIGNIHENKELWDDSEK